MVAPDYAVFALSFAASAAAPGPDIAAVVGTSLSRGVRRCAPLGLGIIAGKLILLAAAMVGGAAIARAAGPGFTIVEYLGAAYLCYLGLRTWQRARSAGAAIGRGPDQPHAVAAERRGGRYVILGLALALSNPIAIAFYLALLPGVIDLATATVSTYLVLAAIVVVVMSLTVLAYGAAVEVARKLLAGDRGRVWLDRSAGAILVAAGAWLGLRALL
jgi:threonine/homoserine/homoserine lactone efflux protein